MGAKVQPVLSDDDLNGTDREILDLLHEGRVSPPYVRDELDKSREYSSERLIRLNEHGHVRRIAPGLYELVDDPRGIEVASDVDLLRDRVADLEAECDELAAAKGEAEARAERYAEAIVGANDHLGRALADLPDDVIGHMAVEDAKAALDEAMVDG